MAQRGYIPTPSAATTPGPPGIVWTGAYNGATTYGVNDGVTAFGSSYVARVGTTGVAPVDGATSATWLLIAEKGASSAGGGGGGGIGVPSADQGLVAAAFDPVAAAGTSATQAGIVQGVKVHLTAGQIVTGVAFAVQTAGAGITGTPAIGLYTETGARVAATGNLATQFQAAFTPYLVDFAATYTATYTGSYFVGFLAPTATTQPTFRGITGANADMLNVRTGSATPRFCQLGVSGQTALPTEAIPTSAVSARAIWAGLY